MNILHEHYFVIETKLPKKFENKQVMTDHGIATVPATETEYEYQWFMGIGIHPDQFKRMQRTGRPEPIIPMNMWTPYPAQAAKYKDREQAEFVLNEIMGGISGGYVVHWNLSHQREGRQIIVPIPNEDIIEVRKS